MLSWNVSVDIEQIRIISIQQCDYLGGVLEWVCSFIYFIDMGIQSILVGDLVFFIGLLNLVVIIVGQFSVILFFFVIEVIIYGLVDVKFINILGY